MTLQSIPDALKLSACDLQVFTCEFDLYGYSVSFFWFSGKNLLFHAEMYFALLSLFDVLLMPVDRSFQSLCVVSISVQELLFTRNIDSSAGVRLF